MTAQPCRACDFFLKTGTARTANYPYTGKPAEPHDTPLPFRAVAWGYVSPDENPPTTEELKAALLRHGPLVVDLTDTVKFRAYQGGLFNEPAPDKKDLKGKHAVLLVGWDDSRGSHGAWKIKNTWDPLGASKDSSGWPMVLTTSPIVPNGFVQPVIITAYRKKPSPSLCRKPSHCRPCITPPWPRRKPAKSPLPRPSRSFRKLHRLPHNPPI